MAIFFPAFENIQRLTTPPTEGELFLLSQLGESLDDTYEVFFNPFLDGDRPDVIVLKKGCGAAIIEVKDWNLVHYRIDRNNKWRYGDAHKMSPQQQAFRYKSNFFNLHLPVLGLKKIINRHFYGVITPYVYFHNATKAELAKVYEPAIRELTASRNALNRDRANVTRSTYEEEFERLSRHLQNMDRDLNISWARDRLPAKIRKLSTIKPNNLFTDDIYEEFKRRLAPPRHVLRQGKPVRFDTKQHALTISAPGLSKIKGVAGCGKTSILAQRAINARARHGEEVLILSFNITLRHFIRDTISLQQGKGADNGFGVTHFHAFIDSSLDEVGIDWNERPDLDRHNVQGMDVLARALASGPVRKFKTILIDEAQDFHPEWIKLIHDKFLDETDGEMVLFADQNQNIYKRDGSLREPPMARGFGRWKKLTKSYRCGLDTRLVELFKRFQAQYLASTNPDAEIFDSAPAQASMSLDLLSYESYGASYDAKQVCRRIRDYIKQRSLPPNDVSIICSEVDYLIPINEELMSEEKTKVMFETKAELDALSPLLTEKEGQELIERLRRCKKMIFAQNSGLIKLSTTHSFKGHESETIFCILTPDDTATMAYTGITRAQKNLVIFDVEGGRYESFFQTHIASPGGATSPLTYRLPERG
ncbi:NERD domain-containing protein [Myxococcus sp. CA056]|uniref:NERD domain-containing protein n=1 Tax=Myxococcus sp. CA056 TaxID=2741740 RepID=UPI00157B08C7|nr:NERD domain-containing protein [Myxococcus sp. CA056]NTX12027.1 NERD domain-containing protein [Myxococcus sp. CA056]